MMLVGDQNCQRRRFRQAAQLCRSKNSMHLDDFPLDVAEILLPVQQCFRQAQFPDVVQHGGHTDGLQVLTADSQRPGLSQNQHGNIHRMGEKPLINTLHRPEQQQRSTALIHPLDEMPEHAVELTDAAARVGFIAEEALLHNIKVLLRKLQRLRGRRARIGLRLSLVNQLDLAQYHMRG